MARFVRKLGTSSMRYLFDLTVHQVELRVPYEVKVGIVFKCSNKRQESKTEPIVNKDTQVADFKEEKLTILSSIYRDK